MTLSDECDEIAVDSEGEVAQEGITGHNRKKQCGVVYLRTHEARRQADWLPSVNRN